MTNLGAGAGGEEAVCRQTADRRGAPPPLTLGRRLMVGPNVR